MLRKVKPNFFVAENVHGLIHTRNKSSFENILDMFKKENYEVSWKLLKASDYEVPQDRERVFIVGYHKSMNKRFVFPSSASKKVTLRDSIGDLVKLKIGVTNKVKNHEFYDSGYSPIFLSRNRVRNWDEQSFTILATDRHIPFHPQAPKMIQIGPNLKGFVPGYENKYRVLPCESVRESRHSLMIMNLFITI